MSLMRLIRCSKFRHVYGQGLKREQGFEDIRVSKSSWDSTLCTVNPKFVAIILETSGGGAFIVLPHGDAGRIPPDYPLVSGHKSPVLDIAWCPHNDNLIASASDDCTVKVWTIPDGGLKMTLKKPTVDLDYHQRRVGLLLWHPTAQNVLLTAAWDKKVVIWNVDTARGEILVVIDAHPEVLYSASFNWNGSRLVTTCRDKKIRIFDPRTAQLESEAECHESARTSRAIYLRSGQIFTTGFTRGSRRQYTLRDPHALHAPIAKADLDMASGVLFPFYDPGTNMIYLCGKGDVVIKYFEVTSEPPYVHYVNTYQATEPQRGIAMMPKRGCDITACEVAKFYRLQSNGHCQVVSMMAPRKADHFQEDIYPNALAAQAAITAKQWMAGVDAEPITFSLRESFIALAASKSASNAENIQNRSNEEATAATSSSNAATCNAATYNAVLGRRAPRSSAQWEQILRRNQANRGNSK
ncbi:coronin-1B-like [Drosophila obscura]|uniref:coronin-1B-like n=1 Tax=Drosophila obscura TaxID=7282 RepID=UPI001BB250D3|nr:coronin-1B-like [Drosophila obscura]